MRRREFMVMLSCAASVLPRISAAQSAARIGVLFVGSGNSDPLVKALQEGLRQHGHIEGQNVELLVRSAGGSTARLPALAGELISRNVDLIVAFQTPAVLAAKRATADIPIVMGASGDPVGTGIIASLARPGGNVTGMTGISGEIGGKNLELVREVVPSARAVGALLNAPDPFHKPFLENLESSGPKLGLDIRPFPVKGPNEIEKAFTDIVKAGLPAVVVQPSLPHPPVVKLALKHRLPTVAPNADYVTSGGLMSYSADQLALAREAASFVDKILKGRKPADLPVQLPTKFHLVINLKTANALGLTLQPTLLTRADEVIE